jgi:ElaB/YqjD/DUF883 family membrane-anchored ribosome-binding protein
MTTYHPNGLHETGPAPAEPGIADRARDEIGRRAGAARNAAADAQAQATDALTRGGDETARFVRDNPGAALAGAVGIGVLIGLALGSARR